MNKPFFFSPWRDLTALLNHISVIYHIVHVSNAIITQLISEAPDELFWQIAVL